MPFHKDFDHDFDQKLIQVYKEATGCFECAKPNPPQRCSKCKVVWYCDRDCQVSNWKRQHQPLCRVWCDNRAPDVDHGESCPGPIPICMLSCGYIGEASMIQGMKVRGDLFLKEVERSAMAGTFPLSLMASVIEMFGKIRLVIGASFIDDDDDDDSFTTTAQTISHILIEDLEEGDVTFSVNRLYEGSGTLMDTTKEKVRKALCSYTKRMTDHKGKISSITFGRGLMFISEDSTFQKSVEEASTQSSMIWVPDMRYAMGL